MCVVIEGFICVCVCRCNMEAQLRNHRQDGSTQVLAMRGREEKYNSAPSNYSLYFFLLVQVVEVGCWCSSRRTKSPPTIMTAGLALAERVEWREAGEGEKDSRTRQRESRETQIHEYFICFCLLKN